MMLKRLLYLFMSNSPKNDAAANSIKAVPYTLTRGSLMFAMVIKLDIAHTVGHSRLMANPGKSHWEAIKEIMRYLKGTKGKSLCDGKGSLELHRFCDSDMTSDVDPHKPANRYLFMLADGAIFVGIKGR